MKNAYKEELIGKKVTIENHIGIIIDETKNIITIEKQNETKKFIKKNHEFIMEDGTRLRGDLLVGRPQDRIKKKIRC